MIRTINGGGIRRATTGNNNPTSQLSAGRRADRGSARATITRRLKPDHEELVEGALKKPVAHKPGGLSLISMQQIENRGQAQAADRQAQGRLTAQLQNQLPLDLLQPRAGLADPGTIEPQHRRRQLTPTERAAMSKKIASVRPHVSRGATGSWGLTFNSTMKTIKSQLSYGLFDWAVSATNAKNAHNALMGFNDTDFNRGVQEMVTQDGATMLRRYLAELQAADPKLVAAFTARLGESASTRTAKEVMRNSDPGMWGRIMGSLRNMKSKDAKNFTKRFGAKNIMAKSIYAGLRAKHQGWANIGNMIGGGMKTLSFVHNVRDPKGFIIPTPSSAALGFGMYTKAMSAVPGGVARLIHRSITSGRTTVLDSKFVLAAQKAGIDSNQAMKLLRTLKNIYN